MSVGMKIESTLSQGLAAARAAVGDEKAQSELGSALLSGARVMRSAAQARAPRGTTHRVKYRGKARPAGRLAERGIGAALTPLGDQDVPGVGAQMGLLRSWFYGMFFEFGTRKIPPRPFIRPTLSLFPQVIAKVAAVFKRRIDRLQASGGGAR